ncbi:MAG: hypothetical protein LC792_18365 [Actinobacteria bacterium]|nr:hypothetical protein [Actinomycetota bacterium]
MRRSRVLADRTFHVVIVNTKSGKSFRGVLVAADERALVLRDASALGEGERGENVVVDGEVIVLCTEVDFIQRP